MQADHRLAKRQDIGTLIQRCRQSHPTLCRDIEEIVHSSDFRKLNSGIDEIAYLYQMSAQFSYRVIADIFGISKSYVHLLLSSQLSEEATDDHRGNVHSTSPRGSMLLTHDEEEMILQWIAKSQLDGDCPTPRQVRNYGSLILEKRIGEFRELDLSWWKRFKERHPSITTSWAVATESARVDVTRESVMNYFGHVLQALSKMRSPVQLLNLDECGLYSRPDKGRKRRAVSLNYIERSPTFREGHDSSHITLTACVNLAGDSLTPFILGISELRYTSEDLFKMGFRFIYERTLKGRQTLESFRKYCAKVLAPYVEWVRTRLGDKSAVVYLILDNATVHNVEDLFASMGIIPIWLPAHSSHFLQVLDLLPFAELKRAYRGIARIKTKPLIEGKILRVLKAWHHASYPLNICNAWQRAGIVALRGVQCENLTPERFALAIKRITDAVGQNCCDAAEFENDDE